MSLTVESVTSKVTTNIPYHLEGSTTDFYQDMRELLDLLDSSKIKQQVKTTKTLTGQSSSSLSSTQLDANSAGASADVETKSTVSTSSATTKSSAGSTSNGHVDVKV